MCLAMLRWVPLWGLLLHSQPVPTYPYIRVDKYFTLLALVENPNRSYVGCVWMVNTYFNFEWDSLAWCMVAWCLLARFTLTGLLLNLLVWLHCTFWDHFTQCIFGYINLNVCCCLPSSTKLYSLSYCCCLDRIPWIFSPMTLTWILTWFFGWCCHLVTLLWGCVV